MTKFDIKYIKIVMTSSQRTIDHDDQVDVGHRTLGLVDEGW